jgi:steroid 5-alpha reductase family enzyme
VGLLALAILTAYAAAVLSLVMALAWWIARRSGNSGWIDVIWTFGTGGVAATAALIAIARPWLQWRQLVVAVMVLCWCLRLGLHITTRTRGVSDDPRYRQLIIQWGACAGRQLFWFLQTQAAVGIVLVVAIMLAAHNPDPAVRVQDVLGIAILIGAVIGEAVADRELRRFRALPGNRHSVCDVGLWAWSRHPNYFFEWLAWIAYPMIAIDLAGHNPYGWIALAAPALIYWVLVHVSGIPPLEQHMLRSRGEVFRTYQHRTPAFFPWPMRK